MFLKQLELKLKESDWRTGNKLCGGAAREINEKLPLESD